MSGLLSVNWALWVTNNVEKHKCRPWSLLLVFIFPAESQKRKRKHKAKRRTSFCSPSQMCAAGQSVPACSNSDSLYNANRTTENNYLCQRSGALNLMREGEKELDRERICALLKMKATESDTMMWRVLLQLCWNAWKIQCTRSSSNTCSCCEPLTEALSGCRSVDLPRSYSRWDKPSRCGPNLAPMAGVLGILDADGRWNRNLVPHDPVDGFQIWLLCMNLFAAVWWSDTNVIPYWRWDET